MSVTVGTMEGIEYDVLIELVIGPGQNIDDPEQFLARFEVRCKDRGPDESDGEFCVEMSTDRLARLLQFEPLYGEVTAERQAKLLTLQWTPAATLPERDTGWVLVCVDFQRMLPRKGLIGHYDHYRKVWRTELGRVPDHWKVTHWMPLPLLPGA